MLHRFMVLTAMTISLLPLRAAADEGTFDSNGVKIRYVTEGKGEAIILIHGWMGDSSMWGRDSSGNTKLTAAEGFQAIAIDCRGHGKSDKPHDIKKYGAEMAADVVRLMDHLKIKKAHLIGYSMGTFIASKVAATAPNRVISVIYGGQAPLLTGESGSREIDLFANAVDEGKGLGEYIVEISPSDRPKPTLEQANAYAKFMYGGKDLQAFSAAGRSFKGLEVSKGDLAKCKAPVLFLYGSKESGNLKERVSALGKILANVKVKEVAGSDHITTVAKPEFGAAIMEFLESNMAK